MAFRIGDAIARRSASLVLPADRTTIPGSRAASVCWCGRFRSAVRTRRTRPARAEEAAHSWSLPIPRPRPYGRGSRPDPSSEAGECSRREVPASRDPSQESPRCLFEESVDLLAAHGRKVIQELVHAVASLQVLDECLDRDAGPDEHGRAREDFRVAVNDAASGNAVGLESAMSHLDAEMGKKGWPNLPRREERAKRVGRGRRRARAPIECHLPQ